MQHSRLNKGQGLVEYAMLLRLVAIVVTGSVALTGPSLGNIFSNVAAQLEREQPSVEVVAASPATEPEVVEDVEPKREVVEAGPSFADLSAAVASCVTNNGARNSLTNAANHENLSTFNTLLSVHRGHMSSACHNQLSSMASSMS